MYDLDDLLSIRKPELEQWIVTTSDKSLEEHLFVAACAKNPGVLPIDVQEALDHCHPTGESSSDFLQACVRDFELLHTDMQQIIEQYAETALRELEQLHKRWDRELDLNELTKHKQMMDKLRKVK